MFSKHHDHRAYADLSTDLREENQWQVGSLRSFKYRLDVVSMAVEPMSGLLAIGIIDLLSF
jgi:syntaxin-binding protein 5